MNENLNIIARIDSHTPEGQAQLQHILLDALFTYKGASSTATSGCARSRTTITWMQMMGSPKMLAFLGRGDVAERQELVNVLCEQATIA